MKCVYYFYTNEKFINGGNWGLTTSINKAKKLDVNYKLATTIDLDDFICATGHIFKGIIRVQEGVFKWEEKTVHYRLGLTANIGDYELVK